MTLELKKDYRTEQGLLNCRWTPEPKNDSQTKEWLPNRRMTLKPKKDPWTKKRFLKTEFWRWTLKEDSTKKDSWVLKKDFWRWTLKEDSTKKDSWRRNCYKRFPKQKSVLKKNASKVNEPMKDKIRCNSTVRIDGFGLNKFDMYHIKLAEWQYETDISVL